MGPPPTKAQGSGPASAGPERARVGDLADSGIAYLAIRFFIGCALVIPMIIQTIGLYPS